MFGAGDELLLASDASDILATFGMDDSVRRTIASNMRRCVLMQHAAPRRAEELEGCLLEALKSGPRVTDAAQ